MNIFSHTLYELSKRFQPYAAWKLAIITLGIGFAWITWQVAMVTSAVYLTVASLFAPEGSGTVKNTGSSFFSSAKYSWNMATYHSGSGKIVGERELPQGTMKLYREQDNQCVKAPCFKLVTILKDAKTYPIPTTEEINTVFGKELNGTQPHEIYGHSPYRRARDLIIYHYDTSLFYGSLAGLTGYSVYARETTDAIKSNVDNFLKNQGRTAKTIYCGYKNEGEGKWLYKAVYWYKKRPPGTGHEYLRRNFGKNHPLLQIFDPVTICPNRYVEQ